MSAEQMKATIRAAVEAWNAGDQDGYHAMYDSSLVHHGLGPEPLDEKGNRAFYERLATGFPGCQLVLDDVLAEEDRVALRLHVVGKHRGELLGVAPTGRPIQVDGQTILKFKDGLVVERWTIADLRD
jgi:predicted ester cyclase